MNRYWSPTRGAGQSLPAGARASFGAKGSRTRLRGMALIVALAAGCTDPPPDTPPRQISESTFQFPEELWDAGVEGETLLELHVSRAGTVDSARVERSSGHAEFDSAAIVGAQQLRFDPARRDGDSVAVRVHLPVQFQIPDEDSTATATPDTASATLQR